MQRMHAYWLPTEAQRAQTKTLLHNHIFPFEQLLIEELLTSSLCWQTPT